MNFVFVKKKLHPMNFVIVNLSLSRVFAYLANHL